MEIHIKGDPQCSVMDWSEFSCPDKSVYGSLLIYNSDCSCVQGSEIFTVSARDGDQGNPNPVHYSIINGQYYNHVIIYDISYKQAGK